MNHAYFAYIDVENIDALYHEFRSKGVRYYHKSLTNHGDSANSQYGLLTDIASGLDKR